MADLSGFESTLNEQQSSALEELIEAIKGTEYEERIDKHPDRVRFLLRILRATMKDKRKKRIFQVKDAKARLFAVLDWKKKYDVDINKKPPEFDEYRKIYPALYYPDYRAETIVWIQRQGEFVTSVKKDCFTPYVWNRCTGYMLEHVEEMLRQISEKVGREIKGYYSLADMGGLGLGMFSRFSTLQLLSNIAAENYPETVERIFIMNTPWIFPKAFNFVKPFLDPVTLRKFEIKSSIPKDEFRALLDVKLLPTEYGGENTDDKVPYPFFSKKYSKESA